MSDNLQGSAAGDCHVHDFVFGTSSHDFNVSK
jgi:hypothetical protein